MVEKKLNFNQPILSVRKYSPKKASHIVDQREGLPLPHRPERSSGPVRNPGSVPFMWEQIPGRPKEEILAQSHVCAGPLVSPEPPPSTGMEALLETSEPVEDEGDDLGTKALVRQQEEAVEKAWSDQQHENVITVCCLLPRSCLKSSAFSLNPVSAMSRVMTFPGSRMLSESPVSGSSTDTENECNEQHGPFLEEAPRKKSFKTLQELLADDGVRNVVKMIEDDGVKIGGEVKMIEDGDGDEDEDSDQDSSSGDDIRLAVNKAAENARERLARGSVGPPPPPPPLPVSPSDSWLSRTLSSASARKASSSAFVSRFSNKC
ncbi:uncharacterized protein LOC131009152 [Salvia miltiorrhiza]|uniref:uncharacterized protein LOC131009152 n=1 Tax=Salvia miltiorrhiza TaxID=226208 RepID=UPI0025ABDD13|nr:uncharacterized protein LOC131009152 [Salvia miltiorrhiza]